MNTILKNRPARLVLGAVLAAILALPAYAADGDKTKIQGLITRIDGDTVTLKDANNQEVKITLSPETAYRKNKGLTGVIGDKVERSALMEGLRVNADVVAAGEGFNASEISFKAEDFRTAQQVQAGLERGNARMDNFGTYDAVATAEVLFASGKTAIDQKGKDDLLALVAKSKELKDFRIVVQGFTDSTGDAAMNQRLSTQRAGAVTNFLQQEGGVSPGRVMAGDGMGVAPDAGSGSNASARKVVAKLVVDKGVSGN